MPSYNSLAVIENLLLGRQTILCKLQRGMSQQPQKDSNLFNVQNVFVDWNSVVTRLEIGLQPNLLYLLYVRHYNPLLNTNHT